MKKIVYVCLSILIALGCQNASDSPVSPGSSTADFAYSGSASGLGATSGSGSSGVKNLPAPKAGVITAGEWHDLANWAFWVDLMRTNKDYDAKRDYWKLYPNTRYGCTVQDATGTPYSDVLLTVRDRQNQVVWEGRTDLDGRASIVPDLYTNLDNPTYTVTAAIGQRQVDLGALRNDITFTVPASAAGQSASSLRSNLVDIQLVVDATGSMGDEMSYLKNEFDDVLARVYQQVPDATIRLGSVFYRDQGDDYLTRELPFTEQSATLMAFIAQQSAGGGGDTPEAVEVALDKAINNQSWSASARTRLLFLVLDAPPHHTPQIIDKLRQLSQVAASKGIRIIPITASGIDKETEFLMRMLAIGTQGTYVFITNDSGIGNPHLIPSVGDYQVEYLNELMLRLIVKYAKRT